jgi:hypothetical protein
LSNPFIPLNCIVSISILFILKAFDYFHFFANFSLSSTCRGVWTRGIQMSFVLLQEWELEAASNSSSKWVARICDEGWGPMICSGNISCPSKFSLKVYTKTVRDGQTQIDVHFCCLQVAYEIVVFIDVTSSWGKCGMFSAGCCSFWWYYHKALAN